MVERPIAFGINIRVKIWMCFVEQLPGRKAIKPQQPICLIEPVLTQKRRLGIHRGQKRVAGNRHISGIEHTLEAIFFVERGGKVQDCIIRFRRRAHDHLRALPCGRKFWRVTVAHEVRRVFRNARADEAHRAENICF